MKVEVLQVRSSGRSFTIRPEYKTQFKSVRAAREYYKAVTGESEIFLTYQENE